MMLGMMKAMMPKTYAIESKSLDASGNRATLQLSTMQQPAPGKPAQKALGKVTLMKENGEWKVEHEEWGSDQAANASPPKSTPPQQASLAPITSEPVRGEVTGARFLVQRAYVEQHDIFHLRQGADYFPDQELVIFLFLDSGRKLDGLKLNVTPETSRGFDSPHIHVRYKVPDKSLPETKIFMQGYKLRLEFEQQAGKSIPGKIELEVPTQPPTHISGAFVADIQ
jgi:hypothetical protein